MVSSRIISRIGNYRPSSLLVFGFLLAVCFNPYIFTAATQPRWSFLAVSLPLMILVTPISSPNHFTLNHLLGLLFFAWLLFSITWAANRYDASNEIIQFSIIAMAFVLGGRLSSLKQIFIGLALGLTISSLIITTALANLIPQQIISIEHEGLLGNKNMFAEASVLVLIGCLSYRLYWLIPGLLPAIITPIALLPRGAILGLCAAGMVYVWSRSKRLAALLMLLSICAAAILINTHFYNYTITQRFQIWTETLNGIFQHPIVGWGLGSFRSLYPFLTTTFDTTITSVEHPHNELLELWFETGAIGLLLYILLVAVALGSADNHARPILAAFFVISLFAFPTHVPVTAFVAALVMGYSARNRIVLRLFNEHWRLSLRRWHRSKAAN